MTGQGAPPAGLLVRVLAAVLIPMGAASSAAPSAVRDVDDRDPGRRPRAAVFRAAGFPTVDAPAIEEATLERALSGLPAEVLGSPAVLSTRLFRRDFDVLVLPYGSAFPVDAWPAIRRFVNAGAAWWSSAARPSSSRSGSATARTWPPFAGRPTRTSS